MDGLVAARADTHAGLEFDGGSGRRGIVGEEFELITGDDGHEVGCGAADDGFRGFRGFRGELGAPALDGGDIDGVELVGSGLGVGGIWQADVRITRAIGFGDGDDAAAVGAFAGLRAILGRHLQPSPAGTRETDEAIAREHVRRVISLA